MGIGIWQIIVIAVLVVILFGRGKISELMGDVAKGITSFRKGLAEGEAGKDDTATDEAPKVLADQREAPVAQDDKAKQKANS